MVNYCACIVNNVVSEIIVADYQWVVENLDGNWVDLGSDPLTIAVGYFYDEQTNTFTPPPPEPSYFGA